jgi:hypothetical protein
MKHVSSGPVTIVAPPTPQRKRRFARKDHELEPDEELVADYTADQGSASVRQWEPGLVGTSQVFGVVAQRSQWRRSANPATGN